MPISLSISFKVIISTDSWRFPIRFFPWFGRHDWLILTYVYYTPHIYFIGQSFKFKVWINTISLMKYSVPPNSSTFCDIFRWKVCLHTTYALDIWYDESIAGVFHVTKNQVRKRIFYLKNHLKNVTNICEHTVYILVLKYRICSD